MNSLTDLKPQTNASLMARRAAHHRGQGGDLPLPPQILLSDMQTLDQALRRGFGVAGVDALLLAGALFLSQPG